jgi:hypothetical protein
MKKGEHDPPRDLESYLSETNIDPSNEEVLQKRVFLICITGFGIR